MTKRTKVAFLGLGAMGARMASRLAGQDVTVKVWSRSGVPEPFGQIRPLLAPSAAAAVHGAELVIAMLRDDEASRSVWLDAGALESVPQGSVVIECSTLTPNWVSTLAARARRAGLAFVDAPVVGSLPQAVTGELIFLAGGAAGTLDEVEPTLLRMGKSVQRLGQSPSGAVAKLLVNTLFTVQVGTLAEMLALARRAQLDPSTLLRALGELPVVSLAAKSALGGMVAESYEPLFPVALAAKDLRYAASLAASQVDVPLTHAARMVFERAIECALEDQNLTAVAKLYAAP